MALSSNARGSQPGVCTSTTRPTSPYEGQTIYETDTDLMYVYNGSAFIEINSMLTKAPRGIMGLQTITTAFATTGTHTAFQDTGMTLTITEVSGRRYKITALVNPYPSGTAQTIQFRIVRGATNIKGADFASNVMNIGIAFATSITCVYTSVASGSATYKTQMAAFTNNTTVNDYGDTTFIRQLLIEDIGAA